MRALALILPLFLAACDREKYDAPRNSSSSPRITQTAARDPANDPATRRREQFAASANDSRPR